MRKAHLEGAPVIHQHAKGFGCRGQHLPAPHQHPIDVEEQAKARRSCLMGRGKVGVKFSMKQLYLPFSDWFGTKRTSVYCQINRTMVNTIWFRLDLKRFTSTLSMSKKRPKPSEPAWWGEQNKVLFGEPKFCLTKRVILLWIKNLQ